MKSELRKAEAGDTPFVVDGTFYRLRLDNEELVDAIRGGYEWRLIRDVIESSKDVAAFDEAKRHEIIQHCCISIRERMASLVKTRVADLATLFLLDNEGTVQVLPKDVAIYWVGENVTLRTS